MLAVRCVLLVSICCILAPTTARAEKDANLHPVLLKPGKRVAKEVFDGPKLPKGWTVNKGDWQVQGGALVGWEKKEDKHAAVLTLPTPFKSSILRFSFKRDGVTGFNLSFNRAGGHLFRILIADDGLTINKDRDKKEPNSKAVALGKAEGNFATGQWHTLLVEIQGDKVSVQADNGVKLLVSHPSLDIEKTGYRFVTRGSSLLLDDLTIWQVEP
jgi:hypothetical protein